MLIMLWIGLAGLGLAFLRAAAPYSRWQIPRWLADAMLIVAIVLLAVAILGAVGSAATAYQVELVFAQRTGIPLDVPLAILVGALLVGVMRAGTALATRYDPRVEILHPLGRDVPWMPTVYGSVWPPETDVQVFVLSGGEEWWPKTARVDGAAWRVPDCQIGNERPGREKYQLVAIAGAPLQPTDRGIRVLPKGIARSQTVTVRRT